MTRFGLATLVAAMLTCCVAAGFADQTPAAGGRSKDDVKALALQWFEHMQAGRIDRTQLTPEYSEHLTDDAVTEMSRYLKSYGTPTGADVVETRTIQDQTFDVVKLFLPRGDALSLIIGFDQSGKITGITFASMGQE